MINFKSAGINLLVNKFKKIENQFENKIPLYKRIGVNLLNEISNTFKEESHEGRAWKPLSIATISIRRKGGGRGRPKILQDTGTLKRSFVMDANNTRIKIGTPIKYASKHEFGFRQIPQRKMLPSRKKALSLSVSIADKYFEEKLKEALLKWVK